MRNKSSNARLLNASKSRANSQSLTVQKNSVFEGTVKDLADTGNAIVDHPSGLLFFVAGAWLGERIKVRVLDLKSRYGIGELVQVLEASPHRLAPPCPHQGVGVKACGGCAWMFVTYEAQLLAKQTRVHQAIRRFDEHCALPDILPSASPLGYRIRAQFKTNGSALGFVAEGKHDLVAIDDCLVLSEKNRATFAELKAKLPSKAWAPSSRKIEWTTLDIDEDCTADEVSVNQRRPFQQANAQQNIVMKHWLQKKLESLDKQAHVLELFAGSGNFTEVLAQAGFENIVAVEAVDQAIESLNNRRLQGVTAISCNLFDEQAFKKLLEDQKDTKILVLDPPRDGLKVKDGVFGKKSKLRDIFYISCDLSTLCRDLREFKDNGFSLLEVQTLDLMPQTPHVEMLCHLRKGK